MKAHHLRPLTILASFVALVWLCSSRRTFQQVFDCFTDAVLDVARVGATAAVALFAYKVGHSAKGSKRDDGLTELLGIIGMGFVAALIVGREHDLRGQIFGMLVIYLPACLALTSAPET